MTYLPDHIIHLAADRFIAGELPGLSPESLRAIGDIHERRGERLSALQYEEMAQEKEVEVEDQKYQA